MFGMGCEWKRWPPHFAQSVSIFMVITVPHPLLPLWPIYTVVYSHPCYSPWRWQPQCVPQWKIFDKWCGLVPKPNQYTRYGPQNLKDNVLILYILNFFRWKSAKVEAENYNNWRHAKCSEKHKTLSCPPCTMLPEVALYLWLHLRCFIATGILPCGKSEFVYVNIIQPRIKRWLTCIHAKLLWYCKLEQPTSCYSTSELCNY